jgi:eukaryotic-like serine/threonine-protein kinase
MGVVWEAEELANGRRVALKLLAAGLMNDPNTVERFVREGRLAAQLSHPRTTFVYGAGAVDSQPYITMELMPGATLQDILHNEKQLPVNRAVDYILDVIEGLIAAHELGVVHRDVKPSNCFMDSDGRVKVGDFGLSKSLVTEVTLTQTGTFMGTPLFAAPEQIRGGKVDERTDIYSVGTTLFTLIAGRAPFSGDALSVTAQIVTDRAPLISKFVPSIPKALERIIQKTLEKDPANRYASLTDLREALAPFATGGTSIADIGRRAGAYMIDVTMLGIAIQFTMALTGAVSGFRMQQAQGTEMFGDSMLRMQLIASFVSWLLAVIYFSFTESIWGKTVGKKILQMQVVDMDGQRPNIFRVLLRSLIIPGNLGISVLLEYWKYKNDLGKSMKVTDLSFDAVLSDNLFRMLISFVPVAICLAFMRRSNGFRGLHEIISGTRVLRLVQARRSNRLENHPVIAPTAIQSNERFGPYFPIGVIAESQGYKLLQARDDLLNRTVWLELASGQSEPLTSQQGPMRQGRVRWLQDGKQGDVHWDAYESIAGAPIGLAAKPGQGVPWKSGRLILLNLANELLASIADKSIPRSISLDHIWVDQSGNAKLVDRCLLPTTPATAVDTAHQPQTRTEERAVQVFIEAVERCTSSQILPMSASKFRSELRSRPLEVETLNWAKSQLDLISFNSSELTWDGRLGVMCMSIGMEMPLLTVTFSVLSMTLKWSGFAVEPSSFIAAAILLVAVFLAGWFTRGSMLFHLMGIRVRRRQGTEPSRFQTGLRNAFSWVPILTVLGLIVPIGIRGLESIEQRQSAQQQRTSSEQQPAPSAPASEEDRSIDGKESRTEKSKPRIAVSIDNTPIQVETPRSDADLFWILPAILVCFVMQVLFALGAIVSIVNPSRGIQDFLVGTRLVPE